MHRAHSFRKVFNFIQSTYIYWVSITHIVCSKHYTKLVDFQWAAVKSQMNSGDVNISRIQTQREKNHPKHPCILPYNARRYRSWNIFSTKQLRAVPTATPEVSKKKKEKKASLQATYIRTHAHHRRAIIKQGIYIYFFLFLSLYHFHDCCPLATSISAPAPRSPWSHSHTLLLYVHNNHGWPQTA